MTDYKPPTCVQMLEGITGEFERAIAFWDRPKGGQRTQGAGPDFAHATSIFVQQQIRWWAREMRATLEREGGE